MCVCLLLQDLVQSCLRGEGGIWRTCATRDDEPRPVWSNLPITHLVNSGFLVSSVLYGKRSFSVTTPCARPTRVNTERLAERETLLYRLGSKLNRIVSNSCGNPIIRSTKTRDFPAEPCFFANGAIHTKKEAKEVRDIFHAEEGGFGGPVCPRTTLTLASSRRAVPRWCRTTRDIHAHLWACCTGAATGGILHPPVSLRR